MIAGGKTDQLTATIDILVEIVHSLRIYLPEMAPLQFTCRMLYCISDEDSSQTVST
jgi:hypothetical protein